MMLMMKMMKIENISLQQFGFSYSAGNSIFNGEHEREDIVNMGDFDALDELKREPTEEEIRADRAANVREYFRTKRSGEDFRPVAEERKRYVFTDTFNDFKEFTSTIEEKSQAVEEAIDSIAGTIGYLLPKDSFDW
jgi:hypothetical protein